MAAAACCMNERGPGALALSLSLSIRFPHFSSEVSLLSTWPHPPCHRRCFFKRLLIHSHAKIHLALDFMSHANIEPLCFTVFLLFASNSSNFSSISFIVPAIMM